MRCQSDALPICAAATRNPVCSIPKPTASFMSSDKHITVLLLEDSVIAARLVEHLLKSSLPDHTLLKVETLQDGMEQLDRNPAIDAVLLDLNLPDSSGLATFKKVHDHRSSAPIVILSGDSDEAQAVEAVRRGAQDYLVKSRFDENHLSRAIRFALERAHRQHMEHEVAGAERVQQLLYPASAPEVTGYDIAGAAFPAEHVSGDYFDFIPMSGGRIGIIVGDVSGHGLAPSLKMAETRAYLHALTYETASAAGRLTNIDLAQVLTRTNELLLTSPTWQFVSLFFLCLDPARSTYTYASAGHEAWHLKSDRSLAVLDATGPILGVIKDAEFSNTKPATLAEGEMLILATDGFVEAMNADNELFGKQRMMDVIQHDSQATSETILNNTWHAACEFSGGAPQADDMTGVVIRRLKDE